MVVPRPRRARGRSARRPSSTSTGSPQLRSDATRERLHAAERACELIRAAWREAEELQLSAPLALEALLVRLRDELAGTISRV